MIIYTISNSKAYDPDNYTDGVVKQSTRIDTFFLTESISKQYYFDIQKNTVESDHRYFSLGFK